MARMKLFTRRPKQTATPTPKKPQKERTQQIRQPGPGARGWPGRGGGMAQLVPAVKEYRGTTVQVCGLWPFSSGASSPMIGVPLGRHEETQATVCCDPISSSGHGSFPTRPRSSWASPGWENPHWCAGWSSASPARGFTR
jgi:hypothetical protein